MYHTPAIGSVLKEASIWPRVVLPSTRFSHLDPSVVRWGVRERPSSAGDVEMQGWEVSVGHHHHFPTTSCSPAAPTCPLGAVGALSLGQASGLCGVLQRVPDRLSVCSWARGFLPEPRFAQWETRHGGCLVQVRTVPLRGPQLFLGSSLRNPALGCPDFRPQGRC